MSIIKKLKSKLHKKLSAKYSTYVKHLSEPLLEHSCLLEAGQGKNINGNMFALLRALQADKYAAYEPVFVVTKQILPETQERFEAYGFSNVKLVLRNTPEYQELLARSKYLFTDNSFPTYFTKRNEQVYLNTWHGTPLKHLGFSDLENSLTSFANVQKNMLDADYVLYPNQLTEDVFFDDYRLRKLYGGTVLHADYPRNDVLSNMEVANTVRKRYGLENMQVIAYMPTWRGKGRTADVERQTQIDVGHLTELDKALGNQQILFVNLHFLIADTIDYTAYKHIRPFPAELETYDFLSACDMLVTDYSSVFFDFAVTGRPIVLYAYDEEEYMEEKGTYLPLSSFPFPIAHTTQELTEFIRSASLASHPDCAYEEFQQVYCPYHTGATAEAVLEQVLIGGSCLNATHYEPKKFETIVYSRDFQNSALADSARLDLAEAQASGPTLLCFIGKNTRQTKEFLRSVNPNTDFLALPSNMVRTSAERLLMMLAGHFRRFGKAAFGKLESFYSRECARLFHGITTERFVDTALEGSYPARMANALTCEKIALDRPAAFTSLAKHKLGEKTLISYRIEDVRNIFDHGEPELTRPETYYSNAMKCRLVVRWSYETHDSFNMAGIANLQTMPGMNLENMTFCLEDRPLQGNLHPLLRKNSHGGSIPHLARFSFSIPKGLLPELPIHSGLRIGYADAKRRSGSVQIKFNVVDRSKFKGKNGRIFIMPELFTTVYFRQRAKNQLCFTVRDTSSIDPLRERIKIRLAHLAACVTPQSNSILLFEKQGSRYEESASVVYERLIDEGYDNVYFLLNEHCRGWGSVPPAYRRNIVRKNSMKHYYLFFNARTFIGSEELPHAIDLRPASRIVTNRLMDKSINYVFLQHGVMYMLSLDSSSRSFFKPKKLKGVYRVVVSSEREKAHFVERGKYKPEMLYVCGLPKYDRNTWNPDADLIAIMPTWRPWEYNAARLDFRETGYFKLIQSILHAVPDNLLEHVKILPHPLFLQSIQNSDVDFRNMLVEDKAYDTILQRTKLLITDYSSIAFDAFYRGANVIFFWKDKEKCMERYGANSEIMLDDETLFGDVAYDDEELARLIQPNYQSPQKEKYKKNYTEVVAFHDGRNTDRLMQFMREDGII